MSSFSKDCHVSSKGSTVFGGVCPACGTAICADAKRCQSCKFTGSDVMPMFGDKPPPLLPLFDAAAIWKAEDIRKIERASFALSGKFPQFRFRVCTVMLPAETSLPLFGFWLVNVSPLDVNETAEDRAWVVLLLIDARCGRVAVVPGYSAERCLADELWMKAMSSMSAKWKTGKTADAVVRFFETSSVLLNQSWKLRGRQRSKGSNT
jgi:hypothetical protein